MIKREGFKFCPSCKASTPENLGRRILSRSAGKETASWRCFACLDRMKKPKK